MRTITLLTSALFLSAGLSAQYTVTVNGHVDPCNGPDWVMVSTAQGTQPYTIDTVLTNANCYYESTLELTSPTGWIQVFASCGVGIEANNAGAYTGTSTITIDILCGSNAGDCQATFDVMQGMDSGDPNIPGDPVPNEIWLIDNSSSSAPPLSYLWNFDDGNFSTDPAPEHTYMSGGNYTVGLTIADATNCVSSYFHPISVDEDGMLGMMAGGNDRSGFILRVFRDSTITTSTATLSGLKNMVLWPNPVEDMLNISFPQAQGGTILYSVIDALGREVATGNRGLGHGSDQFVVPVGTLGRGSYLLRISINDTSETYRFVKQ